MYTMCVRLECMIAQACGRCLQLHESLIKKLITRLTPRNLVAIIFVYKSIIMIVVIVEICDNRTKLKPEAKKRQAYY